MKTKNLGKLLVGGAVAIGLGAPFLLVRADIAKDGSKKGSVEIESADDGKSGGALSQFEKSLKRFFEGFSGSLDDGQKKQLGDALDQFRDQLKEPPKGGEPRQFKFEWRSDQPPKAEKDAGSAAKDDQTDDEAAPSERPKPRRKGRVEPEDSAGDESDPAPADDQLNELREELRRQFQGLDLERFGDDFFGPFMRDLRRMQEGGTGQIERLERNSNRTTKYEKAARRALAEFRPVVEEARESVATIYHRGEQAALATIVSADGYALSKASMLGKGDQLEAEFSNGEIVKARVVDTLKDYDLALLKLDATGLKAVRWTESPEVLAGTLLAAAGPDEDPIAIGVLSVPPRNLSLNGKGLLGIVMDNAEDGVKIQSGDPREASVRKDSAADKAGLREGDVITVVDGTSVRTPLDLKNYISRKKPEEQVRITYKRDGREHTTVATLGSLEDIRERIERQRQIMREGDLTARMGGRGNNVADGFPSALQNDLFIKPNECGGPIVGIDGAAHGINIARAERTKTYAIPAGTLKGLLATLKDGKFNLPADVSELKRAARQATDDLESARQKLREAEEKARDAEEALKEKAKE